MIFPEINVIHLPERIDREQLFLKEFAEQGITSYRIWPGIINHISFVGISAAHKQIVRDAKTRGLPKVLIAEDDVKFTSKTSFEYFLNNEPGDCDIYLSSFYMGTLKPDNTVDDFSGLTLYIVYERYYQTFLDTPLLNHIDRAQAEQDPGNPAMRRPRGIFKVCYPFTTTQYITWSDNHKALMQHDVWMQGKKLYNDKNPQ